MNARHLHLLLTILFATQPGHATLPNPQNHPSEDKGVITEDRLDVAPSIEQNVQVSPIIHFCCGPQHYFDLVNRTCTESGKQFHPTFHTEKGVPIKPGNVNYINVTLLNTCPSYYLPGDQFKILKTGQLSLKGVGDFAVEYSETLIQNDEYCLLWVEQNNSYEMSALVCFGEPKQELSSFKLVVHNYLLPITMAISALFLGATFLVYCFVRELQDLLGKSLMCSIASLALSKIFLVIVKAFSNKLPRVPCVVVALLMYLGFLNAFFWLNVISFLIFFSICFQGRIGSCSRRTWFKISCVYAFGMPLVIISIILIHDFTSHFDNPTLPKPGFGVGSCGFTNRGTQVLYFYSPVSILLGINLILFCISASRLFILAKQTSAFAFQFTHYLKLFVLMGIPWIFEVLSFFLAQGDEISIETILWLAFDIFNALQGVIIFVVFACRRAVLARLSERFFGGDYARRKYPSVFLQHANEETNDALTQDLRMYDAQKDALSNTVLDSKEESRL